jgi:hypothetical protein
MIEKIKSLQEIIDKKVSSSSDVTENTNSTPDSIFKSLNFLFL